MGDALSLSLLVRHNRILIFWHVLRLLLPLQTISSTVCVIHLFRSEVVSRIHAVGRVFHGLFRSFSAASQQRLPTSVLSPMPASSAHRCYARTYHPTVTETPADRFLGLVMKPSPNKVGWKPAGYCKDRTRPQSDVLVIEATVQTSVVLSLASRIALSNNTRPDQLPWLTIKASFEDDLG